MDFSAEGILARMKAALKNEDTKMEGSFSMDNLQAVAEELARLDAMRIVPLMNTLTDKEEDMGTSGNERHYVRWAKEATDAEGMSLWEMQRWTHQGMEPGLCRLRFLQWMPSHQRKNRLHLSRNT